LSKGGEAARVRTGNPFYSMMFGCPFQQRLIYQAAVQIDSPFSATLKEPPLDLDSPKRHSKKLSFSSLLQPKTRQEVT
jgi:hypothetical protein